MKEEKTIKLPDGREATLERVTAKNETSDLLPVSPMRAEIVLRKLRHISLSYEAVRLLMDDKFPNANRKEADEIVVCLKTVCKCFGEDWEFKLSWLDRWAAERPTKVKTIAKESASTPFVLTGVFAEDRYRPLLDAGVKCGYLNEDYSRRIPSGGKGIFDFFVFASLIAKKTFIGDYRKEVGKLWFNDEKALDNARASRISNFDKKLKRLEEVNETLIKGK